MLPKSSSSITCWSLLLKFSGMSSTIEIRFSPCLKLSKTVFKYYPFIWSSVHFTAVWLLTACLWKSSHLGPWFTSVDLPCLKIIAHPLGWQFPLDWHWIFLCTSRLPVCFLATSDTLRDCRHPPAEIPLITSFARIVTATSDPPSNRSCFLWIKDWWRSYHMLTDFTIQFKYSNQTPGRDWTPFASAEVHALCLLCPTRPPARKPISHVARPAKKYINVYISYIWNISNPLAQKPIFYVGVSSQWTMSCRSSSYTARFLECSKNQKYQKIKFITLTYY